MSINPQERLTAQDALKHPWILLKTEDHMDLEEGEEALKNLSKFRV